jgi:hypothetical protein
MRVVPHDCETGYFKTVEHWAKRDCSGTSSLGSTDATHDWGIAGHGLGSGTLSILVGPAGDKAFMVASGVVGDRAGDTGYYACHLVSPRTKNSPVLKGYLDGLGAGRFFTFVTPRMDFHASGVASGEGLTMPASILGADGRTYHARYALVRGDGAARDSFIGTGERAWPHVRFARMVFGTFYPSVPSPYHICRISVRNVHADIYVHMEHLRCTHYIHLIRSR